MVESRSPKTNQSLSRDENLDGVGRKLRSTGRKLPIMAFDIAALVLPFIGVGGAGKEICSLFVGVISSGIVADIPDEVNRVELRYRFLGNMLFSQGLATHI